MVIEINAAFPIEWGKEYYTVERIGRNYNIAKWELKYICAQKVERENITLYFRRADKLDFLNYIGLEVKDSEFYNMVSKEWGNVKIYNDYKEALAEVKRLNVAEKVKGDVQE